MQRVNSRESGEEKIVGRARAESRVESRTAGRVAVLLWAPLPLLSSLLSPLSSLLTQKICGFPPGSGGGGPPRF